MTKPGDKLHALVQAPGLPATTSLPLVVNDVMRKGDGTEEYVGFEGLTKPGFGPLWPRWYFYPAVEDKE